MKLRNKKTGEIADLSEGFIRDTYNGEMIQIKPVAISNKEGYVYGSLAELNEEWEDYEETKKYWGIDYSSCRIGGIEEFSYDNDKIDEFNKAIGNYFETKEEAEKAVEKLKALKRLRDKGFKFTGWEDLNTLDPDDSLLVNRDIVDGECVIGFRMTDYSDCIKDLDLLFGGEE